MGVQLVMEVPGSGMVYFMDDFGVLYPYGLENLHILKVIQMGMFGITMWTRATTTVAVPGIYIYIHTYVFGLHIH